MSEHPVKTLPRLLTRYLVMQEWLWSLLPAMIRNFDYFRIQRNVGLEERFLTRCESVFANNCVIQGPFVGLRYASRKALGSAIYPKLVGSYESELHVLLEKLLKKNYPLVIDIGFAEGYYLIGLGKRLPNARLIGYDIDPSANAICSELAKVNAVSMERCLLLKECIPSELSDMLPCPSLIVCDCEGFEIDLFTFQSKSLWKDSDLIIECHDFINPNTQDSIISVLTDTHKIHKIQSESSETKLSFLDSSEFDSFSNEEKLRLVNEFRPTTQTWIVAESLQTF
ncbi:MAG: hypothetical protein HEQ24_14140 [Dolichospermum sp. BR01]|nr:hypothetical protein [Dolichospermum sp. BR01]